MFLCLHKRLCLNWVRGEKNICNDVLTEYKISIFWKKLYLLDDFSTISHNMWSYWDYENSRNIVKNQTFSSKNSPPISFFFFFKLKTHFEKRKRKKEKKKGSNTKLDLILPTNTICLLSSNVHTHTHIHTHTHTNTHTQRQIAKSSFKGSNNDITKGIIKKVEHRQL